LKTIVLAGSKNARLSDQTFDFNSFKKGSKI